MACEVTCLPMMLAMASSTGVFYTVPGDPSQPQENAVLEKAVKTWTGEEWYKTGGGGTVWNSMAFDPELNLLYFGVGNGTPWSRELRSPGGGDNLFLSSILAVNPDNGEYVWHYQTTPGESWNFSAVESIILADIEVEGQPRKVLIQAPKNGFFYVLDRATGELLSAQQYIEQNWASHIDMATGAASGISFRTLQESRSLDRTGAVGRTQLVSYELQSAHTAGIYPCSQRTGLL